MQKNENKNTLKRGIKMKKNVLVFPCGSEIGLEINRALQYSIHFEMFGASSISDHGKYVYKNYIEGLPFIDDESFIDRLNEITEKYKINFIFPAHDSAVLKMAQNADKLKAKVVTSPAETCEICRSKSKTYKKLKNVIKVPKTYSIDDDIEFPVFIKPDAGQGSKGAAKVKNRDELLTEYNRNPNIVISEYLSGEEFTIDCFTDRKGKLLFAEGRRRIRIMNGICVNSEPVKDNAFQKIAEKINSVLKFRGVWFFQLKKDKNNEYALLEAAPRIAGTMGMYRGLGVNFAQLSLFDAMGYDVKIQPNTFNIKIDRALYAAYQADINYDTVYADLDDTLICGNKVNTDVIKFLYQAKNENKKIVLLSKHEFDIKETLEKNCISLKLFDEIIRLKKTEDKAEKIKSKNAVFIDDSFAERGNILQKTGIAVFSPDSIEVKL